MLGRDRCALHKKHTGTPYAELVLLHLVGTMGHVVHSAASGARNFRTLFFMFDWAQCGLHKKRIGICYSKLVVLHLVGSAAHVVHFAASGRETAMHYFLCSGEPGAFCVESVLGHVMANLCFCVCWVLWFM
jgi:hypothetical protein